MSHITLTALLLVGGQSRRMGADKATLLVAGEPLWARQLRVLSGLDPREIAVSARARPAWCPAGMAVVLDEQPSRGPLSGLASALRGLQTTHLVALAVDLPRMTTGHLRGLLALARPGCGVVPVRDDRFEPLCAIYPAAAAGLVEEAIQSDDVSLQRFARLLGSEGKILPTPVSPEDGPLYHNLNTPEDFDAERGPRASE
jgi:molybdopterin-guanine dinucleotide biosynthesis protein A